MTDFDLYTPPPDKVFNEIKEMCIFIWNGYDDTYGYATEKINRIKDIKNVGDNTGYMIAMFDSINQIRLMDLCQGASEETKQYMEELYDFAGIYY